MLPSWPWRIGLLLFLWRQQQWWHGDDYNGRAMFIFSAVILGQIHIIPLRLSKKTCIRQPSTFDSDAFSSSKLSTSYCSENTFTATITDLSCVSSNFTVKCFWMRFNTKYINWLNIRVPKDHRLILNFVWLSIHQNSLYFFYHLGDCLMIWPKVLCKPYYGNFHLEMGVCKWGV